MTKLYLGCDVGLTGAIALVNADGGLVLVEDMPTSARGNGRVKHEVDAAGLLHILRPVAGDIRLALVERVGARPGQGVASMFSLGHSSGCVDGTLSALGVPHAAISPAKWKAQAGLPAEKPLVLAAARRRWPDAPLDRVRDHGRAEALYLALLAARHARDGFGPVPLANDRRPESLALPAGVPDAPENDSAHSRTSPA